MYNIWKIFTTDIRRISNNVVAVVIIMGLSILPALYAWFNIFSNWDPYEPAATSQLKVAVSSDDAGAEIMGLSLNVGDSVLEALGRTAPENDFEAMQQLEAATGHAAPASLAALRQKAERFDTVIDPAQIAEVALGYQA